MVALIGIQEAWDRYSANAVSALGYAVFLSILILLFFGRNVKDAMIWGKLLASWGLAIYFQWIWRIIEGKPIDVSKAGYYALAFSLISGGLTIGFGAYNGFGKQAAKGGLPAIGPNRAFYGKWCVFYLVGAHLALIWEALK